MSSSRTPFAAIKRYALWALCVVLILVVAGNLFWRRLPYQNIASQHIIQLLKANHISVSSLQVDHADSTHIALSDVTLDGSQGLTIGHVEAHYTLANLMAGMVNDIEAENINVTLYKKDGKFLIGGLEEVSGNNAPHDKTQTVITDNDELRSVAPNRIVIRNLTFSTKDNGLELSLPLNINFSFDPLATLYAESTGISIKAKPYQLTTGQIRFQTTLQDSQQWQGDISIPSITITGMEPALPPLHAHGTFSLNQDRLQATIGINSDNNLTNAEMELSLPVAQLGSGNVHIKHFQLPWGGGVVSSQSIDIPLDMKRAIPLNIHLDHIDLSDTLGKISNGRINGTGKVTGMFPLLYNPDGTIILKDGMAEETHAGTISVSPDLLPGDNAQLALVRTMLENFHYTRLKILVSSQGEKSAITLELEGKNPDAQEKRPVKFTVNVTGDVLPLLQQSVIPFDDIKKLLTQVKQ